MPKKPDRRVQRTRALLQDALRAMMVEKGYEDTTVQDIIDRANVGRSTFYAHFADKETLLISALEDLRGLLKQEQARSLSASGGSEGGSFGFSIAMLEHARGHWPLYQKMAGRKSGSIVLQRMQRMLTDLVRDDLAALGLKGAPAQRAAIVEFVAGAFMGLLLWWLEQGSAVAPREVDAMFRTLVLQGVGGTLTR